MLTSASLISLLAVLAASDEIQDSQSLLQSTISRHQTDACTCLSWKDVYANHGVKCGEGQELTFAGGMDAYASVGQEFCVNFYEKVTSNVCVNQMFGSNRLEQWCYVSSGCPESVSKINGGEISWKTCDANKDKTLGSMTPDEVHQWSKDENKDAGLVLKMAYPISQDLHWPDIKAALEKPQEASERVTAALQKAKDSNQHVIYDSWGGHPPFGVVYGSTIVESHFSAWVFEQLAKGGDLFSAPGKMNDFECLQGCKEQEQE